MASDPLTEILLLARARGVLSTGLRARGDFAIRVEMHEGMKFNAVTAGSCILTLDDGTDFELCCGDCFLLTKGIPFTIASGRGNPTLRANEVFANAVDGYAVLVTGDGPEVSFVGGKMRSDRSITLLTASLPPVLVLRRGGASARRVEWLLDRLKEEQLERRPGAEAMSEQIMHMIFIEMIRSFPRESLTSGWLAALTDPKVAKAIHAMHGDPGRKWRLEELASVAGLSRSQFAARFSLVAGEPPLEYLTRWRMELARDALIRGAGTIAQLSQTLGYGSEAAFGAAFKRLFGSPPKRMTEQDRATVKQASFATSSE